MKREWRMEKRCAEPGCKERVRYSYATKRDMTGSFEARQPEWRCLRHSDKSSVLALDNLATEARLVSSNSVGGSPKLFWGNLSGFLSGPGFRAFADDFPPGTTLIVSARVELPSDYCICPVEYDNGPVSELNPDCPIHGDDSLPECPLCGRTDAHEHQIP